MNRPIGQPLRTAAALLAALLFCAGCKTFRVSDVVTGLNHHPDNVYRSLDELPVTLRRVAVLPATCDTDASEMEAGRSMLEPVIREEFSKTLKFEVIPVSPEKLRALTGRVAWRAEEVLPTELLRTLREELECDAVLFVRLTQFRAYPPLAVGLSLKLVDVDRTELVWVLDEQFDASEPSVVNGARRFQQERELLPAQLADSRSILNSPGVFGRYAANIAFRTLPRR
jgi:hypothetical protein